MATKVFMEALSPTMEEGRLVKWLKNEGDAVKSGDPLAEVETDKAIMELVARGDGVLRKRLVNEGDARPVGQLVGVIAAADEIIDALVAEAGGGTAAGAATAGGKGAADDATRPSEQVITQAQESASASSVPRTAAVAQGEASAPPQQKAAAASAPPPPPPPSPTAATPTRTPTGRPGSAPPAPEHAAHAHGNGGVRSSPLARRLASEQGFDIAH